MLSSTFTKGIDGNENYAWLNFKKKVLNVLVHTDEQISEMNHTF